MALGLDGTASIYATSGTSAATGTLTCSNSGNWIVVAVTLNSSGQSVSSVTGTGATFAVRKKSAASGNIIEVWEGYASGTFSSAVTVNFSGSTSFATVHAYGVNGAPSSSQHDTNASIPGSSTSGAVTISTDNANDFLTGAERGGQPNPRALAAFTRILGGTGSGYQLTQYQIVSATQSSLSVEMLAADAPSNGNVADAFVQSSGSAIKTINGLALASVKTVNGLAIASVKTVNGLA